MRNVIILATDGVRYAVELRWVSEVISLGYVTPVPGSPPHVYGVVNVRGAITPVLDLSPFSPAESKTLAARRRPGSSPRSEGAVIIEVDGITAALRMDTVDEVSSVVESDARFSGPAIAATVTDSQGRAVPLLDPTEVIRVVLASAHSSRLRVPMPPADGATHGQ